jgi:hypothetical protein
MPCICRRPINASVGCYSHELARQNFLFRKLEIPAGLLRRADKHSASGKHVNLVHVVREVPAPSSGDRKASARISRLSLFSRLKDHLFP